MLEFFLAASVAFADPRINACIQSVCGPASGNFGAYDVMDNRIQETSGFVRYWESLIPAIRESVRLEIRSETLLAARAQRALQRGFDVHREELKDAGAYIAYLDLIAKTAGKMDLLLEMNPTSTEMSVNAANFARLTASLPKPQQLLLREILIKVIGPIIHQAVLHQIIGFDPVLARVDIKYKGQDPDKALEKDAADLLRTLNRVKETFGIYYAGTIADETRANMLRRVAAGHGLRANESEAYARSARNLDALKFFFQLRVQKVLSEIPMDVRTALSRPGLRQVLASRKKLTASAVTETLENCRPLLQSSLARNVSGLRLKQAESLAAEVKSAAKAVALTLVSPAHQPALAKKVDSIDIELPTTNQKRADDFVKAVNFTTTYAHRKIKGFADESERTDAGLLLQMLGDAGMKVLNPDQEDPRNSAVADLCQDLPQDVISDIALPQFGRVNMSWYAANFPEVGAGILAHEIGHVISAHLKANAETIEMPGYTDSVACSTARNPFPKTAADTAEEDWADHFASRTLNELQRRDGTFDVFARNFGCGLIIDRGDEYEDNALEPTLSENHSSPFLRLLMVASDRGQVTEACRPFLEQRPAQARQLSCGR